MENYHWKISDGRIWSATEEKFVQESADMEITPLYSGGVPAGVEYLRETILFYGYEIGPEIMSLEEIYMSTSSAIKAKRLEVEYGGFQMDGQIWDSTQKDELRLNSTIKMFEAGLDKVDGWKLGDGVYITLTPELAQKAAMGLLAHYSRVFAVEAARAAELKDLRQKAATAMEAAPSEIDKRLVEIEHVTEIQTWLAMALENGWE